MFNKKVIVDFAAYCPKCKHYKLAEYKDPCNECLSTPVNDNSTKPINWEEPDKFAKNTSHITKPGV